MDNMTALVSAFARAYHYINNDTWVFADPWALGTDTAEPSPMPPCLPLWGRWREAPEEVLRENGPARARRAPGEGDRLRWWGPLNISPCAAIRQECPIPRFAGTSPLRWGSSAAMLSCFHANLPRYQAAGKEGGCLTIYGVPVAYLDKIGYNDLNKSEFVEISKWNTGSRT